MSESWTPWRDIIDNTQNIRETITWDALRAGQPIHGFNAVELSNELWAFICRHSSGHAYNRRKTMGIDVAGHGVELWRRLYYTNECTSEMMAISGTTQLISFPQCTDYTKLTSTLDSLLHMFNKYGPHFGGPAAKTMMWKILPDRMRNTIFEH